MDKNKLLLVTCSAADMRVELRVLSYTRKFEIANIELCE